MRIWRMYLLPRGYKYPDAFDLCYRRKAIGINDHATEECVDRIIDEKVDVDKALTTMVESYRSFIDDMSCDDLVWANRRGTSRFYLGEIKSKLQDCSDDDEYRDAYITHIRKCPLYEVCDANVAHYDAEIFEDITKFFNGGGAVQEITDINQVQFTKKTWDKIKRAYGI